MPHREQRIHPSSWAYPYQVGDSQNQTDDCFLHVLKFHTNQLHICYVIFKDINISEATTTV